MKVALVAHAIHDEGGMERAFAELVRRARGRCEFVVFSRELSPTLQPLVEWRRVRVPGGPAPLRFVLFFVVAGLRLLRARVDLVHTMGAIVPNRVDIASVQFCHAGFRRAAAGLRAAPSSPLRRLNSAVARTLAFAAERWAYRPHRTRLLAAASTGIAGELRTHYPSVPVTVTPNGVDTHRFRPDDSERADVRESHGVRGDETVALFVGGDWGRKGLHVAIEGVARANRGRGAPVRLWVLGDGDRARFAEFAAASGVGTAVAFVGRRPDTERFYRAADVFVFPTSYEAFPLVALEAAASGLPLVTTRANGTEDLVADGETGILVERNAEAVARAIARLASDRELRTRMGETGRRRAAQYTWARSVDAVLDGYAQLTAPGRRTD